MKKLLVSPQGEQLIDLTAEEISLKEQEAEQFEISKQNRINAEEEKKNDKVSAHNKLKALGLTDAEIEAL